MGWFDGLFGASIAVAKEVARGTPAKKTKKPGMTCTPCDRQARIDRAKAATPSARPVRSAR